MPNLNIIRILHMLDKRCDDAVVAHAMRNVDASKLVLLDRPWIRDKKYRILYFDGYGFVI